MYYFGLKIGDSDEELREARQMLQEAGVRVVGCFRPPVTHSLYIEDPDGNEIELYIVDVQSRRTWGAMGRGANVTDPRDLRPFSVKANGRRLGAGTYIHVRIIRKGKVRQMSLVIFLLVVFLIALVAGWGWRAGRR